MKMLMRLMLLCVFALAATSCAFVVGNRGLAGGNLTGLPNDKIQVTQSGDLAFKTEGSGLVLISADGEKWRMTVDPSGALQITAAEE